MTRYQVFLAPELDPAKVTGKPLQFETFALEAVPSSADRQESQEKHDTLESQPPPRSGLQEQYALASPFSLASTASAWPTQGDVTFNYAGAVDSDLSLQSQSPRRSGRIKERFESQKQLPPTNASADSYGESYNTTTASTLPPSITGFASSLAHIPQFRVPLDRLIPLARLLAPSHGAVSGPVTLLVCVVQVDEVKSFRTAQDKKGYEESTGRVASWSVVVPPTAESGEVSGQITFWGRCAEAACGGQVRRGDVVLIENASYTASPKPAVSLSDRAQPRPSTRVLYRTIPRYQTTTVDDYRYRGAQPGFQPESPDLPLIARQMLPDDRALRPDMRVGRSDAAIRRVGELATWFAAWVGGEPPTTN